MTRVPKPRKPLPRQQKPIRRSKVRKRSRSAEDFARIYGSEERVIFVRGLPCAACGLKGWSVNAHVAPPSEKGTSYKAGYKWIAPLCRNRWASETDDYAGNILGCHYLYDEKRTLFNDVYAGFDPEKAARETEQKYKAWLVEQGERTE